MLEPQFVDLVHDDGVVLWYRVKRASLSEISSSERGSREREVGGRERRKMRSRRRMGRGKGTVGEKGGLAWKREGCMVLFHGIVIY